MGIKNDNLVETIILETRNAVRRGKSCLTKCNNCPNTQWFGLTRVKKGAGKFCSTECHLKYHFWLNVKKTTTCWIWQSTITDGYGRYHSKIWGKTKLWMAHRVSYILTGRKLKEEQILDHLCRNRACVNPDHLEIVTNKENVLRGIGTSAINARKTSCINGHPFTKENTYYAPKRPNSRSCKECSRLNGKKYYERQVSNYR